MITVIAGVNGSGKSSILGAHIEKSGNEYYNPDRFTKFLMEKNPDLTLHKANGMAWKNGFDMLKRAIRNNQPFIFETTLGGNSIKNELIKAVEKGTPIAIVYCGLSSPELNISRVASRVAKGGHDIPEEKIRYRYQTSLGNLIELLPFCSCVTLYDNSEEISVKGSKPSPKKILSIREGQFTVSPAEPFPEWAEKVLIAAQKLFP